VTDLLDRWMTVAQAVAWRIEEKGCSKAHAVLDLEKLARNGTLPCALYAGNYEQGLDDDVYVSPPEMLPSLRMLYAMLPTPR
jgi:hypothetical protein